MSYGWVAYEINLSPMDTQHVKENNRTPLEEKLDQLEEWGASEIETKMVALGNKWQPPRVLVTARVPYERCSWEGCQRKRWGGGFTGKWKCKSHQQASEAGLNPNSSISLSDLGLEARTLGCLRRARIDSVETLIRFTPEQLCSIRNFGARSLNEVRQGLRKVGISLNDDCSEEEEDPFAP